MGRTSPAIDFRSTDSFTFTDDDVNSAALAVVSGLAVACFCDAKDRACIASGAVCRLVAGGSVMAMGDRGLRSGCATARGAVGDEAKGVDVPEAAGADAGAGAELVTTEMVLFEWLLTAEADPFREIQALIK